MINVYESAENMFNVIIIIWIVVKTGTFFSILHLFVETQDTQLEPKQSKDVLFPPKHITLIEKLK